MLDLIDPSPSAILARLPLKDAALLLDLDTLPLEGLIDEPFEENESSLFDDIACRNLDGVVGGGPDKDTERLGVVRLIADVDDLVESFEWFDDCRSTVAPAVTGTFRKCPDRLLLFFS